MLWVVENILVSHKLAQQIIAKCQLCCPLIKISENGLWPQVIHPDFLPAYVPGLSGELELWHVPELPCPLHHCFQLGWLSAPWLASGLCHSFPAMGSWRQELVKPLIAQLGALAANSPALDVRGSAEQWGNGAPSPLAFTSVLIDGVCTGGFPGLNAGSKGRGDSHWGWYFLHSCLLF